MQKHQQLRQHRQQQQQQQQNIFLIADNLGQHLLIPRETFFVSTSY